MTVHPDVEPGRDFRLSDIWTNERSRSLVIQIVALLVLFLTLAWIVNNTVQNLENLGVETGYGFLEQPASYDINQRLVEYSSRSTHALAALVGFLYTVLVAVTGIIFATLLGFMVGVLRLSNNWLVSRLMTAYVEFTRNVPVLLHILLWYGIVLHVLPHPKEAIEPISGLFLSNRGFYLPRPVFEDFAWVIPASLVATLVGVYLFARHARRVQERTGKIYPVLSMSLAAIIAVPVVAYFAAGSPAHLDWPALKGFNYKGGIALKPEFFALWFALSIYTAAFIAEIVRGGIVAVSHGQTEAAFSLGIKPGWTMRLVVIPQALRVIVPPLISQYLNLTKNSSLAIAVGYMDLTATIGRISLNQTGRALECMSILLTIYLLISLMISAFMNWYNKRIRLVER
ncbi:MAG: amino acid ABC transporter permease [Alphaproteobacteria bacterium]|nr:amino acid ABC transporter permease [Alphaproteobacteria bacterium]